MTPTAWEEDLGVAVLAPRDEQPFDHLVLGRLRHHVLVPEGDAHDGNQDPEEQLQLSQAVLVQEEKGEGVGDCYEATGPQRYPGDKR
jgi:hypothetical protein